MRVSVAIPVFEYYGRGVEVLDDMLRTISYQTLKDVEVVISDQSKNDDIENYCEEIELLILSKCSTIIGTYDSTFDEVAWWMSGCKSKVIIPTPKNFNQSYHDS